MRVYLFFFLYLFSSSLSAQNSGELSSQNFWNRYKNQTIERMKTIPGWCGEEKAHLIMDLIRNNTCQLCVEIGVFSGKSLFALAQALKYNDSGKVYAIDAWSSLEAIQGFSPADPSYRWWAELDYTYLYNNAMKLIGQNKLRKHCKILRQSSQSALCLFKDNTIDFIHFDGNHNEEFAFQDVTSYFPKVKDGGYILLNDPNWWSIRRALVFLLERADVISEYTASSSYFLFRKSKQRVLNSEQLLNQSVDT